MTQCPACLERIEGDSYEGLARHLVVRAGASDSDHVRWLNQNLTRKKAPAEELAGPLAEYFRIGDGGLSHWIKTRFIAKFFGKVPHPFVAALQHPSRATLLGYVIEHQHFLRQWVRSCAYITARTDAPEVARYELENLSTEFLGFGHGQPSHYELLLRMGEGLGVDRARILATEPLPATARAIRAWNEIARDQPWVSAMAAMHGLELIAHRDLVREGASVHYFDPTILSGEEIPPAARDFLREGYEADVGHADEALRLVTRFAGAQGAIEETQSVFLRSIDLFDDYLIARLERANDFA